MSSANKAALRAGLILLTLLALCCTGAQAGPFHFLSGLRNMQSPGTMLAKEGINVSGTLELHSNYLWRGFTMETEPVLQHGFSLNKGEFTLAYWANWDFLKKDVFDSNELDFSFDYTKEMRNFSIYAGAVYYGYYGLERISRELYAGLELKRLPFSPEITYYYDYSNWSTRYLAVDLSDSVILNARKQIGLGYGAHAGFSDNLILDGRSGDLLFTVAVSMPLSRRVLGALDFSYSVPFDENDVQGFGRREKAVSAGIRLGTTF